MIDPPEASSATSGVAQGSEPSDQPPTRRVRVGSLVGPYRVVRLLGEGAMGQVFEGEHQKIGRRVALKVLAPDHAHRPEAVKRLFNEAMAVNRIHSPHIVEVTDWVEGGPGGLNVIVMELLEGNSLAQLMRREGPLLPERFLPIALQVCEALSAAHAAGFVHRDLKPENIFLTARDGQLDYVKLLDFGLVKTVSNRPAPPPVQSRLTSEGSFLGTPAYTSPEQIAGDPVDHRTDLYALGVILYELICGQLPFEGQNLGEYIVRHLTAEPPPFPPAVLATPLGQGLDKVVRRCLEKKATLRWGSAGELKQALEQLLPLTDGNARWTGRHKPALRAPAPSARRRGANRAKGYWGLALASLGLLLGMAAVGAPFWRNADTAGGGPSAQRSRGTGPSGATDPAVATAPAGRPVPAAATRPPAEILLRFHSDPPGAETRQVGDGRLLGLTPFHMSHPAGDEPATFEMTLSGYVPQRFQPSSDGLVGGRLKRRGPGSAPRNRRSPGTPVGREGTVNPFASP